MQLLTCFKLTGISLNQEKVTKELLAKPTTMEFKSSALKDESTHPLKLSHLTWQTTSFHSYSNFKVSLESFITVIKNPNSEPALHWVMM